MTTAGWNFNTALALATIALGGLVLVLVPQQVDMPMLLFGMQGNELSPRAMPRLAGWLLVVGGLVYLVESLRLRELNGLAAMSRQALANVGFLVGLMVVYVLVLIPVGFVASSIAAAAAIAFYFGSRNGIAILAVAVAAPVLIYLLFTRTLSVSLPPFPLFPGF